MKDISLYKKRTQGNRKTASLKFQDDFAGKVPQLKKTLRVIEWQLWTGLEKS